MGLFDSLFRHPTPEKFADQFIQEMRRAGVKDQLVYDSEFDRIKCGSGDKAGTVNLTNFFREHLNLPRKKRKQHIVDRVRIFLKSSQDYPDDFNEAKRNLRPKLWVRAAIEKTRLQIRVDGGDASKFDIPEYEVGSHLVASLVYDLPDAMKSISKEQLDKWGVTYYEALEIARENLEQTPFSYAQIGDGCYAFTTGDSYDACRLLLPSRMEQMKVGGDVIAMVPNRDVLLIGGSEDPDSLKIMVDLAEKAVADPRPMVPIPLRLDGDVWVDWFPESAHPNYEGFQNLARRFFYQEYIDQQSLLERIQTRQGDDTFLATYTVVTKEGGRVFTYAVWGNGVRTLLPQTEWLIFVRGDNDLAAIARWDHAKRVVGKLMKPTDHYPARFYVEDFPSDAELATLGKADP